MNFHCYIFIHPHTNCSDGKYLNVYNYDLYPKYNLSHIWLKLPKCLSCSNAVIPKEECYLGKEAFSLKNLQKMAKGYFT